MKQIRLNGISSAVSHFTRLGFVLLVFMSLSALTTDGDEGAAGSEKFAIGTLPANGTSTCTLPAPATFDADRTSGTSAYLEWSMVTGAAAYRLFVYDKTTQELVYSDTEYGTAKVLSNLSAGVGYRCVLASICTGGNISDFVITEEILVL